MKIPLAWRNLTHNKRRLCLSLAGIGFVVLLMFMEVGFENAASIPSSSFRNFNADLEMIRTAHPDYLRFPRRSAARPAPPQRCDPLISSPRPPGESLGAELSAPSG